jgi:Polyketide cyclase / dehydrase and lipid transport
MSRNSKVIEATPDQVWDVLADGWLYPLWVVGATRMRAVEDEWPSLGSKLHHSAGVWPLVVNDDTEVLEVSPRTMMRLRARGWPMGEAEVLITLSAEGPHTRVDIEEDVVDGPGRLMPKPLRDPLIKVRNIETLRRLAFVAEGRAAS